MQRTSTTATRQLEISLRGVLSTILFLSLLMTLAACAAGNSTSSKIQLTLWYWDRSIDDNLIKQVGQQFPNIELRAVKTTDYDNKVRTSMAGHYGVPDILGINSNIYSYFLDEDQFVDLRTLGADEVKPQYLPWKWNLGIAPDGKMIGFPMDTGPTAFFYRADIFAKAGLPTDPQTVSGLVKTWNDYLQLGQKVKAATQGKSYIIDTANDSVYAQLMAQSTSTYFDRSGKYIGDQEHIRQIWNIATEAAQMGITARSPRYGTTWNQAASNGLLAGFVGAVWMKQILQDAAPDTAGKWRIAYVPGSAGNSGGSFLGVSKYSQHPKEAFEVIKWLQSPQNQVIGYRDLQLYPSALSALDDPSMHQKEAFYGGQDTTTIFSDTVKHVPLSYAGPYNDVAGSPFGDQLALVEFQNKNPEQAWNDAQQTAQRVLLR